MIDDELSEKEMNVVMTVFRSFETGLREATIYPKVNLQAIIHLILSQMRLKKCLIFLIRKVYP